MWHRLVILVLGMTLFSAARAHSEPISITDGFIEARPGLSLTMSLEGTGFAYTASGYDWTAVSPSLCAPCYAGTTVSFTQLITEGQQYLGGGTGTYQGTSFTIPWVPNGAGLQLQLSGSYSVPSILSTALSLNSRPSNWTITAPFVLSGMIHPLDFDPLELTGQGLMTLSASASGLSASNAFILTSVRFDMGAGTAPTPIPEPATLSLVGLGLAAGALGAVGRRVTSSAIRQRFVGISESSSGIADNGFS
jgi:PEP-CTERM motif